MQFVKVKKNDFLNTVHANSFNNKREDFPAIIKYSSLHYCCREVKNVFLNMNNRTVLYQPVLNL